MLGSIASIIIITVGVILALFILPYAIYITFFPLVRTIGGGIDLLKTHGAEKKKARAAKRAYDLIPEAEMGLTMAYGGDKVEGEKGLPGKK